MSVYYSDSPEADFNAWDADQNRRLESLPQCYECGEPIQDEMCFEWDGLLICEECMENNHKRHTDDFIS